MKASHRGQVLHQSAHTRSPEEKIRYRQQTVCARAGAGGIRAQRGEGQSGKVSVVRGGLRGLWSGFPQKNAGYA